MLNTNSLFTMPIDNYYCTDTLTNDFDQNFNFQDIKLPNSNDKYSSELNYDKYIFEKKIDYLSHKNFNQEIKPVQNLNVIKNFPKTSKNLNLSVNNYANKPYLITSTNNLKLSAMKTNSNYNQNNSFYPTFSNIKFDYFTKNFKNFYYSFIPSFLINTEKNNLTYEVSVESEKIKSIGKSVSDKSTADENSIDCNFKNNKINNFKNFDKKTAIINQTKNKFNKIENENKKQTLKVKKINFFENVDFENENENEMFSNLINLSNPENVFQFKELLKNKECSKFNNNFQIKKNNFNETEINKKNFENNGSLINNIIKTTSISHIKDFILSNNKSNESHTNKNTNSNERNKNTISNERKISEFLEENFLNTTNSFSSERCENSTFDKTSDCRYYEIRIDEISDDNKKEKQEKVKITNLFSINWKKCIQIYKKFSLNSFKQMLVHPLNENFAIDENKNSLSNINNFNLNLSKKKKNKKNKKKIKKIPEPAKKLTDLETANKNLIYDNTKNKSCNFPVSLDFNKICNLNANPLNSLNKETKDLNANIVNNNDKHCNINLNDKYRSSHANIINNYYTNFFDKNVKYSHLMQVHNLDFNPNNTNNFYFNGVDSKQNFNAERNLINKNEIRNNNNIIIHS